MMILRIVISLLLIHVGKVYAQEVYRTTNGRVQIVGVWNDSTLIGKSNKLVVSLDYETAEFTIRLDKSTIQTGVDSLDLRLEKVKQKMVMFEGKLGIDFVQTQSHPSQDFSIEGYLTSINGIDKILGKGTLSHVFGNVYSCVLNMTFNLRLKDINSGASIPGFGEDVQISIIQTILKRESD